MFERIVAAIDSDTERSDQILEAVRELSEAFRSEVLVTHVRDVERPAAIIAAAGKPGALPPTVGLESEDRAFEFVNRAVEELRRSGVNARAQIGSAAGSTSRELLDVAQAFNATLIVVGGRDSHVTDVLLGGVAHRIAQQADCPVLIIR